MTEDIVGPNPYGVKFRFRSGMDDHLLLGGHEWAFVQILNTMLPEGGVFVDVGSHLGLFALNLAPKASMVYAVEANKETYEALKYNYALNPHLEDKVKFIHRAAYDVDDKVLFLVDPNGLACGGSTQVRQDIEGLLEEKDLYRGETVTQTLDTILMDETRVDLIKIDVEGAERFVLAGAKNTLSSFHPVLWIETHDWLWADNNRQVLNDLLEEANYERKQEFPYGDGTHWLCQPREN